MKRSLLFFLISLIFFDCWSQSEMHRWKYYVNSSKIIDIAFLNNQVYSALENGVYQYDINQNEATLWSVTDFLSDVYVSEIFTETYTNSCWVGYKNGNIDFINGSTVSNIPFLKMSDKLGDKAIVAFQYNDKFIYAACSFGILKMDPLKKEVKDTYYPPMKGNNIKDFKIYGDSIYVISDSILYSANVNNTSLSDEKYWKVKILSNKSLKKMHIQKGSLFIETTSNKLYKYSNGNCTTVLDGYFSNAPIFNNIFPLSDGWGIVEYHEIHILEDNFEEKKHINRYDGVYFPCPNVLLENSGKYWIGDRECGLVEWGDNFNNRVLKLNFLPKSSVFSVSTFEDKIGVTGGVISKTGFDYKSDGVYVNLGQSWNLFDRYNQSKWLNKSLFDIGSISFNPKNKNEFAVGSNSFVPLSISYFGKQIDTVFTDSNSNLEKSILGNGFTFVSDLIYDKDGNLWVLNPYSSNPLKLYSAQKKWVEMSTSSSTSNSWATKIKLDFKGNKWLVFPGIGVVGLNTGSTTDNTSDDITRIINDSEVTGALPTKDINAIAVDLENNLWIGTEQGFAILYNAPSILTNESKSFVCQRVKLKYEGNVEYLLGKTSISDIEIDGGNRKWIATTNAGLFLLSADGNQLIQSFTKDNSPLISNNITDIQFNHQTGELFIITDLGLVSYRVDASEGKSDYEKTIVFPNPYKPEHSKGITIQGLQYDSDVKVTDAAGNVVYKTTSNGGTAFWNALDWDGNRIAPGVYFFWAAPNAIDGQGKKVGKVVVF